MCKKLINDAGNSEDGQVRTLPALSGWQPGERSEVVAAVGAEDVFFGRQEASADQGHAAPLAVEAVVVPLAVLKRDVPAASET